MKKILFFIITISLFCFSLTVEAKVIDKDYVDNSTYIIGSHMFTRNVSEGYNGQLTTQHIMLAARTIVGDELDDMVIYYKNARGKWVDALTTEEVQMEEQLDVEIVNLGDFLSKPILMNPYANIEETTKDFVGIDNNKFMYDLSINITDDIYDGWDIFEKTGEGKYSENPVATASMGGAGVVYVPANTTITLVARIYILDTDGNKLYSEVSNEFVINTTNNIDVPVLSNPYATSPEHPGGYIGVEGGKFVYDLATNATDSIYDGYSVFVKGEDTPIANGAIQGAAVVRLDSNKTHTLVAKLFILDTDGNKFYGPVSNDLVIDTASNFETPVLKNPYENDGYKGLGYVGIEKGKFLYDLSATYNEDMKYTGWALFEKGSDKELSNITLGGANVAYIEPNTTKTYVAKYFIKGEDGSVVYGPASNELVLNTTNNIEAPVLVNPYATSPEHPGGYIGVENGKFIYDLGVKLESETDLLPYDGYSIFEKGGTVELAHGLIDQELGGIPGAAVLYVDANTTKTYIAKFYVLSNGNKVYGSASNDLVIDTASNFETPVLKNAYENDGYKGLGYVGIEKGKFIYDLSVTYNEDMKYTGWALFEKGSDKELSNITLGGANVAYIEPNTTKTYVAKYFIKGEDGSVAYGPASNELVLNTTNNIEAPVLVNPYATSPENPGGFVGVENGKFIYDLGVKLESETDLLPYDGYSIFEKGGTVELAHGSIDQELGGIPGAAVLYVDANTTKTYIAKFYVLSNGNKVYGSASNDLVINTFDNIEAPVFNNANQDGDGNISWEGWYDSESGKYIFDVSVSNISGLPYDGWSVFDKENDILVVSGKMDFDHDFEEFGDRGIPPVLTVYLDNNTTKTYYAKFYYEDANGNKSYGPASNDLTFTVNR